MSALPSLASTSSLSVRSSRRTARAAGDSRPASLSFPRLPQTLLLAALLGALFLSSLLLGAAPARADSQQGGLPALEKRVAALESLIGTLQQNGAAQAARIAALEATTTAQAARIASLETTTAPLTLTGTPGTFPATLTITGVNVQVVSGSGSTNDNTKSTSGVPTGSSLSGLGNLIVGYNGRRGVSDVRTGSHNLIIGDLNNYSSFGAVVAGFANESANDYASVTGGAFNIASGNTASVSGGTSNRARGIGAAISGGNNNTITPESVNAAISGGVNNIAGGDYSSVSGGAQRSALGRFDWVAGLLFQDL